MALQTSIHDIKTLILSFHPAIAIDSVEEERVVALVNAAAGEVGLPIFEWSLTRGLVRKPDGQPNRSTSGAMEVLAHIRTLRLEAIFLLKDFARHLEDPAVCRAFRDLAQMFSHTHSALVITGAGHKFPKDADHHVVHYEVALPNKDELRGVVSSVLSSLRSRTRPQVDLSPADFERLLDALSGMTANQARQAVAGAVLKDSRLSSDDVAELQDRKAAEISRDGLLEYFPAEDNPYELGGFERLREWLARARLGFSEQAKALNLDPPSGILLVGVQGCGKSLAAKCIAREWNMPLLKLDAGRLYDKYMGESEKNMRRAIDLAESMAPCVLWIDEIEKGFAQGGDQDGGASQRIFASLLTWLQEKTKPVFLIATANDVFRLPPELLRKGRFDEIFFVDLPEPDERETIFGIHLRHRKQEPACFDLPGLVAASEGFSGAEIEQAVIASLYRSLHEQQPLDDSMILLELGETVPLSHSRREDVARLRELAGDRFVPVR
ncbi:MAG: AAA family ATPase [Deltaproteobacteria bacterium]|nr:AAA family ATPase [Deltaproteobacteria bacterium]MBW2393227.1 AAA family ATPase [Deltaproteobacteria bacterium]